MFTSIIQTVLLHHVGKYLNGLEKNSFNVGLIDGQISIENIGLNNTLFDELQIPLTLKFSNIQKIHIEVPWTKLDEKATIVTIQGIDILLDLSQLKSLTQSTIAFKFEQIISKIKKQLQSKSQKQKEKEKGDKKQQGFAERSLIRILDNIDIKIKNLHVRFQDNSSFGDHKFSFGVIMKQLIFHTADKDGNKVFYKRDFHKNASNQPVFRQLKSTQIKAYWNSQETVFIKQVIEKGGQRDDILQFMRVPFPAKQQASPTKKEKEGDFFKDLFKTRQKKQKQKQKLQKKKNKLDAYQQMISRMKFHNIVDMILTVQSTQNDLNKKDQPLFSTKVWIQPMKVEVQELMISQLLCLLQYYLKYTQDLYYYQNKTKYGGLGNSLKHKKIFNDVMQELFKKLPKIKSLNQIPKQTFKTKQEQQMFEQILNLQSVKNLRSFANDFVTQMKLKKQIQKAQKNLKKKEKASEQIKKLMQKTKNTQDSFQQLDINYSGRVLLDLDCEIGGLSIRINQQNHDKITQSIRLILPLTKFLLTFVNQNNFNSKISSKDLLLDYSIAHKYLDLHTNQHDDFISIQFIKKGKSMNLDAKILKKQFTFPQNLIAFVIKFIEPIKITPFFLNLFEQSTNIDSQVARNMIQMLMGIVPNLKSNIDIDLPKITIQLSHTGVIIDCGRLNISIQQQGAFQVPIIISGLFVQLANQQNRTRIIPQIASNILFHRQFKQIEYLDIVKFNFDKINVIIPEVDIFDKLATDIFQLMKQILKKDLNLIDRQRIKIANQIKLNSSQQLQGLFLLGQLLQISFKVPIHIILYQTNVYPLIHDSKYFIVLLKNFQVNYIQVNSQKQMLSLVQLLNQHIQSLSTINQLKNLWYINSKYQIAFQTISNDIDKFMTFICQSKSTDVLKSIIQVQVFANQLTTKFAEINIQAKDIKYKHMLENQMEEDKLTIKDIEILIDGEKILYKTNNNTNFIQLSATRIISQRVDVIFSQINASLTNQNISPLLESMQKILKTTILRQALLITQPARNQNCRQFFNMLTLESTLKIKQFQCSIMQCAGFINQNIIIKSRIEDNSQEAIITIGIIDIFEMIKLTDLQIKNIITISKQNLLSLKYKSLLFEISPELIVRYLAILESNKDAIVSHYQTIKQLWKMLEEATYLFPQSIQNSKIQIIGSNTQLYVVETEENILQICINQSMIQLHHVKHLTNYIVSLMQISLNQHKLNKSFRITKDFSIILKSNQKQNKNNISLAITKLQVMVGIFVLEYIYRITKAVNSVFLRNQWIIKFVTNIAKQNPSFKTIIQDIKTQQLSVNLQIDEIDILYIKNQNIPYIKLKLKINQSAIEIGKQSIFQLQIDTSVQYFNNQIKMFEPFIEPVCFQIAYQKSPRIQSLKATTKSLKITISNQAITQTLIVFKQIQQFFHRYQDSFIEIINNLARIQQNKFLIIQKQQSRSRSQSRVKQDFTKGFTIRNFKQPQSIEPVNVLKIINNSGTTVSVHLRSNEINLTTILTNKHQHTVPIKIKSQYKHNYQILERIRSFKITLQIDKFTHTINFSIAKVLYENIILPNGKQIRLRAAIDSEGMKIYIVGKSKIINSTPQKFIIKVGVDFTDQVKQNSQIYLPYDIQYDFKISMMSSSSVNVALTQNQTFQQLEFVTFSLDHYTILLTTQVKNNQIIYRLMDSVKIINHFDFKLQFKLGDTGFVLPQNNFISTSKTSLKEIKNIQLCIPIVDNWISVPLSKLSQNERQLTYPLQKGQIKIYIILANTKVGRIIHIYPRLAIMNLTPYKFTLFTSLYQSLFIVNKRVSNGETQKIQQNIKGFTVDYIQQKDCFILDDQRYLHLSFSQNKFKSEQFVGYHSDFNRTVDVQDDKYKYQIKVTYEEQFLSQKTTIFKSYLKPKYYFVNKSDHNIKVYEWSMKPNHLIPFAFLKQSVFLIFQLDYEGTAYKLMNKVQMKNSTRWALFLVQSDKEQTQFFDDFEVLIFGIQLIFRGGYGYFVFSRCTDSVLIHNKLTQKSLRIMDQNPIKVKYQIKPGEKKKYYFHSETFNIKILGQQNQVIQDIVIDLNQPLSKQTQSCNISTYFENADRMIILKDSKQESISFFGEDHGRPQLMVSLSVNQISFSFIFYNFEQVRCETLYLKLIDTTFLKIDYQKVVIMQVKNKDIIFLSKQINNINEIISKQNKNKDFANLYMQIPKQSNTILNFKLQISPIKIVVSDELLELILFNIDKFGLLNFNKKSKSQQFQNFFEFYNKTRQEKIGESVLWRVINLEILEIEFDLEFKKCFVKGNKQMLKSFGFSIAELNARKLKLTKLEIKNSQQSLSQLEQAIVNEYKKQIISITVGVLGALNIIGNPRQFVLEITSGLTQANPGIIRGAGGFFKGLAFGAMSSVSKITSVASNGLNVLSLDETYMYQRQLIKNVPINSAMDGLKAGATSIYKGIQSGFTGLVTQPARGLQQDGLFGILKGSFKGVVGFFTKPIIGALDATSMSTQGMISKQSNAVHERIRPLFYLRKIIRYQCDVQQTCCLFLNKYFPDFYKQCKLVQTILLQEQDDPSTLVSVLVITLTKITIINILSHQITLQIQNQKMSAVAKFSEGVVLYYIDEQEEEIQAILRIKRNNDLKHLLYLTLQKAIDIFKIDEQ